MSLPIVIAPNKIFKQKAEIVTEVNNEIKQIVDQMFDTLKNHWCHVHIFRSKWNKTHVQ